ncbi:MAG: hypothetical protein HN497_05340 [Flavobacteriaceae bacterium]|jgi:hypothetical protein|nr:hypothetical protein [Flavobacteriaceae bacterium]
MKQEYSYVENENVPDRTGIKLRGGNFDGIIYIYGDVRFSEDDPPVLTFDFEVLNNPGNKDYKDSEEFEIIMGDVLVQEIDKSMSKDDRRNDNQKPDNE